MTMIGIDPHKATHTAVAIDDNEAVLDEFTLRASAVQAERLRDWAANFDNRQWAIESANGVQDSVTDIIPQFLNRSLPIVINRRGAISHCVC